MRFTKQTESTDVGFQIAPMIDVVFLLLLFFIMVSVFYRLEAEMSIVIPTADESEVSPRVGPGEIIINVLRDGGVVVNQRKLTMGELTEILAKLSSHYKGQPVIIRGDSKAYHEKIIEVLNACAKADIWNVSFATLKASAERAGD